MDAEKTGALIRRLRIEQKMTQLELADRLGISDKAVSKWERGLGCPDISLLTELSEILSVNLEELLSGGLGEQDPTGGNMKKSKFYVCPQCGNVIASETETAVSCCGKKLSALEPQKAGEADRLCVERMETELFISSEHEMTKEHYISFLAVVTGDSVLLKRQYPEWGIQTRIPHYSHGTLLWYCTKHGLFYQYLTR